MTIQSAKTVRIEKWVDLEVTHKRKKFQVSVRTADGKLLYDDHKQGIATAYLSYFHDVPEKTRAKHYEQIRQYVKRHIK